MGIRVLKGDQTGYCFTEEITPKAMEMAAETAANIAKSGKTVPPQELKLHKTPQYYQIQTPWEDVKPDRKVRFLPDINQKVFSLDKRVIKCRVVWLDEYSHILIANSDGRIVSDYQPMTGMSASCTAEQNGQKEEGIGDDLRAVRDRVLHPGKNRCPGERRRPADRPSVRSRETGSGGDGGGAGAGEFRHPSA